MSHGPKIITLGSTIITERSAQAIDAQPLRKTVHLAEITLIDEKKIGYRGSEIKISTSGFSDLLKILKIPQAFIKRFGEMMSEKPEAKRQFINTIKNVMSTQGSGAKTVTLVVNRKTRVVIAVHKTERNLISNAGFLDVVNQVIDDNNLDIVDFSVGSDGQLAVNAVDLRNQWDVNGLKDEVFSGGVSFINNPKNGFVVSPYISRLVCANGMMSRGFQEQYKLTSTDSQAMQKFYADINRLSKTGFKPENFTERVAEARDLKCSLHEMYKVKNAIKNVAKDITAEELEAWVPVKRNDAAYGRINIDTNLLRAGQLKNAKTDTTVWELINSLTHFATHDNGFALDDYNRRRLQMTAGELLTSEHDMANFVKCPF